LNQIHRPPHKTQATKRKKPLATFKIHKTLNKIQILFSIHFYGLQVTHIWLYMKRCMDTSNFKLFAFDELSVSVIVQ